MSLRDLEQMLEKCDDQDRSDESWMPKYLTEFTCGTVALRLSQYTELEVWSSDYVIETARISFCRIPRMGHVLQWYFCLYQK